MNDVPRKHLRLPVEARTFIEVEAAGPEGGSEPRLVTCHTLDVSREGVKVMIAEQLMVGTILQIGVDLPDSSNTLYLAGEVRWCLQVEDSWSAGLKLLDSAGSDTGRWYALLDGLER